MTTGTQQDLLQAERTGHAGTASGPISAIPATRTNRGAVLAEAGLTAILMFVVVTAIRSVMGAESPVASQSIWLQISIVGTVIGVTLVFLIRSPWGVLSGAHLNPAITVGFWLLRVLPGRLVVPYIAAQTVGAFTGVMIARLLWGTAVAEVRYGAAAASPDWTDPWIFLAEAGVPFLVIILVAALANPKTAAVLPYVLGGISAAAIAGLGPLSGGAINPVRQLVPAVLGRATAHLWIYLIAPIVGAAAAALLVRFRAARHGRIR